MSCCVILTYAILQVAVRCLEAVASVEGLPWLPQLVAPEDQISTKMQQLLNSKQLNNKQQVEIAANYMYIYIYIYTQISPPRGPARAAGRGPGAVPAPCEPLPRGGKFSLYLSLSLYIYIYTHILIYIYMYVYIYIYTYVIIILRAFWPYSAYTYIGPTRSSRDFGDGTGSPLALILR